MKTISDIEISLSDETYNRIQKLVEKYNERTDILPITETRMIQFLLNIGLDRNKTFKFNIQKYECELGLRDNFDWSEL